MLQSIKGIYKDGSIKLIETPEDIKESQVIVTFLESRPKKETKRISFGMFTGSKQSNEDDFNIAEFSKDSDDNLNWE